MNQIDDIFEPVDTIKLCFVLRLNYYFLLRNQYFFSKCLVDKITLGHKTINSLKPALEHLPPEKDHSFVVKFFDYHYYPTPWHYHPEFEIVFVTESTGKRFIGDHISDFAPGNIALLGPNIPHLYKKLWRPSLGTFQNLIHVLKL